MFHSNITNIYGKKGKAWLDELPELVAAIASNLGLFDLKEVANLSYNYVLSGFQGSNSIILKLGLDSEALEREAFALKCFTDCGVVKVIAEDKGMLLLERAVPGTSLKSYFRDREQESIEIACGVMKKLHQARIPERHNFPHIKDWLAVLDNELNISHEYLQKARKLRDQLLQTSKPDVLLHGDLHHDNILQNADDEVRHRHHSFSNGGWVVIDPKGVIGEPAYEVAAFIRNPIPELLNHVDATTIIHNRITYFAEALTLHSGRIIDWCFVQAVLAWVWALEDSCDLSYCEKITGIFDGINMNGSV